MYREPLAIMEYKAEADTGADAVEVLDKDGYTQVVLYFHAPETEWNDYETPIGVMLVPEAPEDPDPDEIREWLYTLTGPDHIDVIDHGVFTRTVLTYEEGNEYW